MVFVQSIPLYVFGQSYGGKIAAHFARQLHHVSLMCVCVCVGPYWPPFWRNNRLINDYYCHYLNLSNTQHRISVLVQLQFPAPMTTKLRHKNTCDKVVDSFCGANAIQC